MVNFTEELAFNPPIEGYRFYREEVDVAGEKYPMQLGGIWLPPSVDISDVEEVIND